jgi:2-hydroxy-3-keto-5-methylthiopentenyl-1-phosphate phosphatase
MSAAQHADVLFVKMKANGETDLATYCVKNEIKFIEFTEFSQAQAIVKRIVDGMTVDDALKLYASKHQIKSQG